MSVGHIKEVPTKDGHCYNPFEPTQWQIFNHEAQNKIVKENFDFYNPDNPHIMNHHTLQKIRFVLALGPLTITVVALSLLPWMAHLWYLTWWGNHLSAISILLCILAGRKANQSNLTLQKAAAVFFMLALVTEFIVVLVYWTVLWRKDFASVVKLPNPNLHTYLWYHKILIHTVPFTCVLINAIMTRAVLVPGHAVYMVIMGLVYMPFNYLGTLYKGEPVYHFLPWKDYKTVLIGFFIFCIAAVIQ